TKNRLWLWWAIYIPLVAGILFFNMKHLDLPGNELSNFILSPQYKIFNSPLIIVLGRIVTVALGAVILLVCLLFPYFNISKGGVQWTKEFQEELTEASGEITGEEIEELVQEEGLRWSLILRWLKIEEWEAFKIPFLLRELLASFWEAFPALKIAITLINPEGNWGLAHSLLSRLVVAENANSLAPEKAFGMKLQLGKGIHLLFHIFLEQDGFSSIDEKFILALGEIFVKMMMKQEATVDELLTYFERISLTIPTMGG
ncbi:MAG TPA: hypothetical protein DDW50_15510, partial [Firmicutes bacterium]|nr:hypothetical protein [Bacillota bacterium]